MVIIWSISFAVFLVVTFGATSVIMVSIPRTYGASIDYDKVLFVKYMNANHERGKQLFDKGDELHSGPMKDILRLLSSAGKTNTLSNLFRGSPGQKVENNNSNTVYTTTFENTYSKNALFIEFGNTQHSVQATSRTTFKLVAANGDREVWGIMIPLDRINNSFQSQTWYLITSNRNQSSGDSLSISNKISTYGNYNKLWKYINDLQIML